MQGPYAQRLNQSILLRGGGKGKGKQEKRGSRGEEAGEGVRQPANSQGLRLFPLLFFLSFTYFSPQIQTDRNDDIIITHIFDTQ